MLSILALKSLNIETKDLYAFLKRGLTLQAILLSVFCFLLSSQAVTESSFSLEDESKPLVERKIARLGLERTGLVRRSKASWYGEYFHGRRTANMEIFNKNVVSAAHKTLPLNTFVLVTNLENDRQLIVRINDRGPYIHGRDIDLSEEAARQLGGRDKGVMQIKYEILTAGA